MYGITAGIDNVANETEGKPEIRPTHTQKTDMDIAA